MTKSQTSKGKENIENSSETDDQYNFDDTSEDTGKYNVTYTCTSCLCVNISRSISRMWELWKHNSAPLN